VVSPNAQTSGNYKTASNLLFLFDGTQYGYCVSGAKMTWIPQSTNPTTTGSITFDKRASAGVGGSTGGGGSVGP
jgi:hypothetical protein